MDSSAEPLAGVVMPADAPPTPAAGRRALALAGRVLLFPVKLFWGMAFCQGLVGSILVLGWTYRLAQRSVLKYWWSRSEQGGRGFAEFLVEDDRTRTHRHWPNWFFRQNVRELRARPGGMSWLRYLGALVLAPVRSLWTNYWIGLHGILTTWTLTLPACLLWWFGWYDGWNNSFNKGYEQAPVGPLISIAGIFLFIAVMFYVPLAQARQAVTGEWRSFYQFRLIWSIVRLRWLACASMALLYSLLALPLNIMKTFPMFFLQAHPELAGLGDPLLLKRLNGYFFWCALLVFPAFVLLRLVAARIYASGVLGLVQSGRVPAGSLSGFENETLQRLGLPGSRPQPERSRIMRLIAWTGSRLGRTVSGFALVFIWFSFVAQIYINEFLDYHGAIGWINQPLVQLPWFHYVPSRLKPLSGEVIFGILVFLLVVLIRSILRVFPASIRDAPSEAAPGLTQPTCISTGGKAANGHLLPP